LAKKPKVTTQVTTKPTIAPSVFDGVEAQISGLNH
jgi:hypothetical protein